MGKEGPLLIDNEAHWFLEKKPGYIMYVMICFWGIIRFD